METNNADILPGHLIGMSLFNPEDQAVLYIDHDPHKHTLHCQITNISDRTICIQKSTEENEAGPDNYHFALRFRRGLLQSNAKGEVSIVTPDLGTDWKVSPAIVGNAVKEGVTIYFLYTGDVPLVIIPERLALTEEELSGEESSLSSALILTLGNLQATPSNGARTTQVELLFKNIAYENDLAFLMYGTRQQLLNVVNHTGHRIAPLLFSWMGNHRLLNNGEQQTIRLRMLNTQRDRPLLFSTDVQKPTKLFFTANGLKINAIQFKKEDIAEQVKAKIDTSNSLKYDENDGHWIFNNEDNLIELDKDKYLEFDLTVTPTTESDTYFLNIHYVNLPGYWDSAVALPIQVSPLAFKKGNVGIGIEPGDATLTVATKGEFATALKVKGRMHSDSKDGGLWLDDKESAFIGNTVKNVGIWLTSLGRYVFNIHKESGKVHIGHDENFEPKHALDVEGDINASGKLKENGYDLLPAGAIIMWSGSKVPVGWVLCDGKNTLADGKTKTPNLIDRFIMGGIAKLFDNEDSTRVNGKNKMVLNEKHLPDHKHTFKMKAGPSPQDTFAKVTEWVLQPIKPERKELYHTRTYHTENIAGRLDANNKKIEVSSFDNRPAYYTLAFIMKL
ncbi:phage tail protein [Marivirga lumbricoides]